MDAVISYVNCLNEDWKEQYIKQFGDDHYDPLRYRDYGTIELVIDSIRTYCPDFNKIYIVVQNRSEVENIQNIDKCIIVTHDQFIPSEYLPTFNSCTIGLFLHNIPGLDEEFVYFNDDIFLMNPVQKKFFFSYDGLPIYNMQKLNQNVVYMSTHRRISKNSFDWALQLYLKQLPPLVRFKCKMKYKTLFLVSKHIPIPFKKSWNKNIYESLKDQIHNSITTARSTDNINTFVYISYSLLCLNAINRTDNQYKYLKTTTSPSNIQNVLSKCSVPVVCINDTNPNLSQNDIKTLSNYIKQGYYTHKNSIE